MGVEFQRGEINRAFEGDEHFHEINNFFMCNYWNEFGRKVSMRWKNYSNFKSLLSIHFREENWSKIEILSLTQPRFGNCRMKLIVWMIRDGGQSHVTSQYAFFPLVRGPGGMESPSLGMPCRKDGPPSIWGTHGKSGNVFANLTAFFSALYPQESNPWVSNVPEHTSLHITTHDEWKPNTIFGSEMPVRTINQKFIRSKSKTQMGWAPSPPSNLRWWRWSSRRTRDCTRTSRV